MRRFDHGCDEQDKEREETRGIQRRDRTRQATRRSTNHGLADQQTTDYKEEISRIKTYPRSGQIDIGYISRKIRWRSLRARMCREDPWMMSSSSPNRYGLQPAPLSQSDHKFAARMRLPYPSPSTLRPVFVKFSVSGIWTTRDEPFFMPT